MADRVARAIKAEPEKQTVNGAAKAAPRFIGETTEATVLELKFPLEWDGQEYRQVELRRLKGKDFSKFRSFGAFIFLCGLSHLTMVLTLFSGVYRLDIIVRAAMAAVSVVTATAVVGDYAAARRTG